MRFILLLFLVILSFGIASVAQANGPDSQPAATTAYLITNDDPPPAAAVAPAGRVATGSFFPIGTGGALSNPVSVPLTGIGSGGGYFAASKINVRKVGSAECAYFSVAISEQISTVNIKTQQFVGGYLASSTDTGFDNGIGLVNNGTYLYASFSTSSTLATFAIEPGCGLQYLSSIPVDGLQLGSAKGMAVHGNLLVVAYGDGSIQSFNISGGVPVSNNDLQEATGFSTDRYPNGVDITQDGHYAIFGDMSTTSTIEVSDISSGKITKTVLYNLGTAANSNNVLLSPDETLLYVINNSTGQVSAAFFDKATGKVTPGCVSAPLSGFFTNWVFLASPVTQLTTGTGSVLYVAEYGAPGGIGVLNVASSAGKCTLTETSFSPVADPNSSSLLSIAVFPPRTF